jgi:hypothetical protein
MSSPVPNVNLTGFDSSFAFSPSWADTETMKANKSSNRKVFFILSGFYGFLVY